MAYDNGGKCCDFPHGHVLPSRYVCTAVYVVEPGDTLYAISQKYNVTVPALMQANRIFNPYSLKIGQKICIPGPVPEEPVCVGTIHTVEEGDTLYMIAKKHRCTLDAVMDANPGLDPYNLRIGTRLCIPCAPCDDGMQNRPMPRGIVEPDEITYIDETAD